VPIFFRMLKEVHIKIEDSNIANYGKKEHHDLKTASAQSEEAWKGSGQKPGVEIWRIEKFKVVPWPKEQYGRFYTGDAYIILHTYKEEGKQTFKYNIHFWLGAECTQDEYGTAAYKTVELDDLFGGAPVQYREVQGQESNEFLALFKTIHLLKGGIESGFKHVKPEEYKPRLLHVKGVKDHVRVSQVNLEWKSLNDGDVFVLDAGLDVFIWNGSKGGIFEKRKAQDVAQEIREQRQGKPKLTILDGLEANDAFWKLLGGKPTKEQLPKEIPDEKKTPPTPALHQLSDSTGQLKLTEVSSGGFKKSHLKSDDVFIVDLGSELIVWVGKGASKKERALAIQYATLFLQHAKRPLGTPIVRLQEGQENTAFWKHFS